MLNRLFEDDRFNSAVLRSNDMMNIGKEPLSLGMRGELEVIARDRNGNIVSYERGHNQVTNFAKMQIIRMLAGELGTKSTQLYSTGTDAAKTFSTSSDTDSVYIYNGFDSSSTTHTATTNLDGAMVSGNQFFNAFSATPSIHQVSLGSELHANYPVKMLFGTGMEAQANGIDSIYSSLEGITSASNAIKKVNGFDASASSPTWLQSDNKSRKMNYYSNAAEQGYRTLQPMTLNPLTINPAATDTGIAGAIKNCLITSTSDTTKFDATTRMATAPYRGQGYPCFIYAQRTTDTFRQDQNSYTRINAGTGSQYETEIIYNVIIPAQPSEATIANFNPYNGWILKQAGLFCDSRYLIGNMTEPYDSDMYKSSVNGMLLFKRNLSSPIVKNPDLSLQFSWHVFITI